MAGTAKVPRTKYSRAQPALDAKHMRLSFRTRSISLAGRYRCSTGFRTRVCPLVHDYSHTAMTAQYNSRSHHASGSLGTTQYLFPRATQSQMFDPRRSSLRAKSYTTQQARHTSSWPYTPGLVVSTLLQNERHASRFGIKPRRWADRSCRSLGLWKSQPSISCTCVPVVGYESPKWCIRAASS